VFLAQLAKLGLPYRFQQVFSQPYYRIVHSYLPDLNLIIEIDGVYHDAERDRRRDATMSRT